MSFFKVFLFLGAASSLLAAQCNLVDRREARYSRLFGGGEAYYYHLDIAQSTGATSTLTPNPFTGYLAGFILGYEYKQPNHLYAVLQNSYALGTITTEGTGNNQRSVQEDLLETRIGYSLTRCFRYFLTPYTGVGFRWNAQHRHSGILPSLTFNYYKIYIPLGLLVNYSPNRSVNLGIDFEWMPDVLSMVNISSLPGSFWELKRMNNYLVQLPCLFTFAQRYELGITPFWYHFWDGASTAVTNAGVALNLDQQMTNEWGGRISLGVHF